MNDLNSLTNSVSDFPLEPAKNSPGRRICVPKTISAADAFISGLYAARKPRRTSGSFFDHFSGSLHKSAALRVRWKRSMRPFACG